MLQLLSLGSGERVRDCADDRISHASAPLQCLNAKPGALIRNRLSELCSYQRITTGEGLTTAFTACGDVIIPGCVQVSAG